MLTGTEIRERVDDTRRRADKLCREQSNEMASLVAELKLVLWQIVAELDEMRYTLREIQHKGISVRNTDRT